jgi:hypothetical protein
MNVTVIPAEERMREAEPAFDVWLRRSLRVQYTPSEPIPDELLQMIAHADMQD